MKLKINKKQTTTKLLLLAHLGTGDHIICNGLYNEISKNFSDVVLPVRKSNYWTVKRMLCHLPNYSILPISDKLCTYYVFDSLANNLEKQGFTTLRLGYRGLNFIQDDAVKFAESFYTQAGIDFKYRWHSFTYIRDHVNELKVFNSYMVSKGSYIFLHEDPSRNYVIKRGFIDSDLPILTPNTSNNKFNFFDYRLLIENAAEIHCIESSFWAFVESIPINIPKFSHRYARPEAGLRYSHEPSYKSKWVVYK